MNVEAGLRTWAINRAEETLKAYNSHRPKKFEGPEAKLVEESVTCQFVISDEIRCCDGHPPEECVSSFPARPVIRVRAKNTDGVTMQNEAHIGDFTLEDFLRDVVEAAGGQLTC